MPTMVFGCSVASGVGMVTGMSRCHLSRLRMRRAVPNLPCRYWSGMLAHSAFTLMRPSMTGRLNRPVLVEYE